MTQPLALVYYEKLMPGSQLVNRLQDLNYRVQTVNDLPALLRLRAGRKTDAGDGGPGSKRDDVCRAIAALKADAATRHIPIIAFAGEEATEAAWTRRKRLAPNLL